MKYRDIYSSLNARIMSGEYVPGARLPTEVELGREFNVSRPTVARAMRDLQVEGLIERRAGDGTYVLEPSSAKTDQYVGLLIPELGYGEIFDPICARISHSARKAGLGVLWGGFEESQDFARDGRMDVSAEQATSAAELLIGQGAAGVFFAPLSSDPDDNDTNRLILNRLRAAGVQVVLLDRDHVVFPHRSEYDLVTVDHFLGQYLATRFLVDQGYKRIAYLRWPGFSDSIDRRVATVHAATAAETKLKVSVIAGDPRRDQCVDQLLSAPTTEAVLCENDLIATLLINQLQARGISVPEQMSVIGFNDLPMAQHGLKALTTVAQPFAEIGDAAVEVMRHRLESPDAPARSVMLKPRLVIRESTAGGAGKTG